MKAPSTPWCSAFVIAALVTTLPPQAARAAGDPVPVQKAKSLYEAFEYEKVIERMERFIQRSGAQNVSAHDLLARCYAIVGRITDARRTFAKVLELDPDFDLPPGTSPKIELVFRRVREERDERVRRERQAQRKAQIDAISVDIDAPTSATGGKPVTVRAQIRDASSLVQSVSLMYRRSEDTGFSSLAFQSGPSENWAATIPGELTSNETGASLHYYVQTFDQTGLPLSVTPAQPELGKIALEPGQLEARRPFYRAPWFWASVGVAIAAGTTAGILGARRSDSPGDLPIYTFGP